MKGSWAGQGGLHPRSPWVLHHLSPDLLLTLASAHLPAAHSVIG